jgi:hypothetical protein
MDIEKINKKVEQVDGLGGMTVNERLYVSGLMEIYDNAMKNDKELAKTILKALKVDKQSIDKILS